MVCNCSKTSENKPNIKEANKLKNNIKKIYPLILSIVFFVTALIIQLIFTNRDISLVFYLFSAIIGGYKIFIKAFFSLKKMNFNMNVLMSLAVIGAFVIGEHIEASIIVILFSLSHIIEHLTLDKARKSINKLMDMKPKLARLISNDSFLEIPVENVMVGSIILVKPSERIPLDGVVLDGKSDIDQSPITGESLPIKKQKHDNVFAGTININGILKIKTTKSFEDTLLKKIIYQVEQATSKKTKLENFIDRFAKIYTPAIMLLCTLIATIPPLLFNGIWLDWLYKGFTILLIGCPCAFIISTPITIIAGITNASKKGILLKGGIYLEKFNEIKNIAFDKTGTLTYGKMKIDDIIMLNGISKNELYEIVYLIEKNSEHPIAKAIVKDMTNMNIPNNNKTTHDFKILEGKGVEAVIDTTKYYIGSHRFFHILGLCEDENHKKILNAEKKGNTIVMIGNKYKILGAISVLDKLRSEIKTGLENLKKTGLKNLIMITGDNKETAKSIACESGIDIYYSELLPDEKVEIIKKYDNIAMVGDGINDAPALAVADIGIAMGGGTDISIETADIVLMKNDIHKLEFLKKLSKKTLNLIKQNIIIAFGIKTFFLIITILGLSTLWMAVISDVGASIIVIINGLRVLNYPRRKKMMK